MEKIKRLILAVIPNQKCNLKCDYCYISQLANWEDCGKMKYKPKYIAQCLSKDRLGGTALINLTGNGETMLQEGIVEIIRYLLEEGHYVEVVTNGTIKKRMEEIANLPFELTQRLFLKISFHYKELIRNGVLDTFYETVKMLKRRNIAFTLELMAYDDIETCIDEIIESTTLNLGAPCQATIGRLDKKRSRELLSSHSITEYKKIWNKLESPMQQFKLELLGKKRREFCYAGAWSLFVDLYTGNAKPCYGQPYNQNIYEDVNTPIRFEAVGHYCTQPYCINGHSHLTWGLIPQLSTPFYYDMRNRVCKDGSCWINNKCRDFFHTKLYENNTSYSFIRKSVHTLKYPFWYIFWMLKYFDINTSKNLKLIKLWKKNKKG